MHIGIVGGGMLGVTLGYFLSRSGAHVTILEASEGLGGRARPLRVDGYDIDRSYDPILPGDASLIQLCSELGLADRLRFGEMKTALYREGRLHPSAPLPAPPALVRGFGRGLRPTRRRGLFRPTRRRGLFRRAGPTPPPKELLTFPALRWIDRLRPGPTVARAERARSGSGCEDRPATPIWASLHRLLSTRAGGHREGEAGHLIGGHSTLIEAMAARIQAAGGAVRLNCPVCEIVVCEGQLAGLRMLDGTCEFDVIVITLPTPTFLRLAPGIDPDYRDSVGQTDHLGLVGVALVLDRPLTGYRMLRIADDNVGFTQIIESTGCIDPQRSGVKHLVHLARPCLPNSRWFKMSDGEVRETWLQDLEKMFPAFDREWIKHVFVERERLVEPIYPPHGAARIPSIQTPVEKLYLANTEQIYPEPANGESIIHHARQAAKTILDSAQPQAQLVSNGALAAWHAARRVPADAFAEDYAVPTGPAPSTSSGRGLLSPQPLALGSSAERPALRSLRPKVVGSRALSPAPRSPRPNPLMGAGGAGSHALSPALSAVEGEAEGAVEGSSRS